MKEVLKWIGFGLLGIVLVYVLWIVFIPMIIGQKIVEREVIQQSPQYVISQRSALFKLHTEYLKADGGIKEALKNQMCEIANNLPKQEVNNNIKNICN